MNNKRVKEYIPKAMQHVDSMMKKRKKGNEKSALAGKINAFGPAIISVGLKPAAALYADKDNAERQDVAKAVFELVTNNQAGDAKALINHVLAMDDLQLRKTREMVFDAIVALKLAVRTFDIKSNDDKTDEVKDEEAVVEGGEA